MAKAMTIVEKAAAYDRIHARLLQANAKIPLFVTKTNNNHVEDMVERFATYVEAARERSNQFINNGQCVTVEVHMLNKLMELSRVTAERDLESEQVDRLVERVKYDQGILKSLLDEQTRLRKQVASLTKKLSKLKVQKAEDVEAKS